MIRNSHRYLIILAVGIIWGPNPVFSQGPSQSAGAQTGRVQWLDELYRTIIKKNVDLEKDNAYSDVAKGSPYFHNAFETGAVYFNASFIATPYLRYDAYSDEIQIKKTKLSEEQYGALLKTKELYCIMDSKLVVYRSFVGTGGIENGYFTNLVNSGKYLLFQRKTIKFHEGRSSVNSLTASVDSKFIDEIGYYFKNKEGNKALIKITDHNQVIDLFESADRVKIKSFIRAKGLKFKAESDLQTLFYYANTL